MSEARYLVGDVFDRLADIPDDSIDLIVTSPPFLALRSYLPADHPDKHKEIGSEATPADFLTTLLALTVEWQRVLAPHGSLCVELGDTYSGSGGAGGDYNADGLRDGQERFDGSAKRGRLAEYDDARGNPDGMRDTTFSGANTRTGGGTGWPLAKSLCLLPTLYPASLAYGRNLLTGEPCEPWRIRNQIVWHRPNPPVGALGDKVRPSTSYITVACTSKTRWFDLDAERSEPIRGHDTGTPNGPKASTPSLDHNRGTYGFTERTTNPAGAPPLDCWIDQVERASDQYQDFCGSDVWTLSTQPYKGSHYATFPITLPRKLINLMCPRQVCVTCGEPRRRIVSEPTYARTDTDLVPARLAMLDGERVADGVNQHHQTNGANTSVIRNVETLGWSDCGHDTWRRGIVLDPFAGSGTTLVAASELGRDSIGIDIDERNHQLARERCGMFLIDEPAEAAS